jgi:hypothetical protein
MNHAESPSPALRAPSPPVGERDGVRGFGSWSASTSNIGRASGRHEPVGGASVLASRLVSNLAPPQKGSARNGLDLPVHGKLQPPKLNAHRGHEPAPLHKILECAGRAGRAQRRRRFSVERGALAIRKRRRASLAAALQTGKSPEPAVWKTCTTLRFLPRRDVYLKSQPTKKRAFKRSHCGGAGGGRGQKSP